MEDQARSDERPVDENMTDAPAATETAANESISKQDIEAKGSKDDDTEKTELAKAKAKPTCGVCKVNPPKYKCPRCYMPYCSIPCNKIHRENHPPDEPKPVPPPQPTPPTTHLTTSQHQPSNPSHPFAALESSPQLQSLFRKYPSLRSQLDNIHEATLPPKQETPAIPASLMQGAPPKKDAWNHDMGIQNGKAALRKAKASQGVAGEAIREYYELVAHVMSESNAEKEAARLLQEQSAQQDTQLIQRLMAQEER